SVRATTGAEQIRLGWGGTTSYAGRLDAFLREVAARDASARDGDTRVIATPQAARLAELLADRGVTATPYDTIADAPPDGALVLARVPLAEGFTVPELHLRVF